ncbi:hypothetical protein [Coraliomargarita parva]|uniref:hypothetical protein n=1 Tax=Coraliomargarita parva TaxID=3014050 RepID=UPI0022B2BBE5|nr:hypothetical protein [Coraliomargarita parva]
MPPAPTYPSPAREPDLAPNRRPSRFIPNVEQLNEALKLLPDPESFSEPTCLVRVRVGERYRQLEFTRKRITRGSACPYRWIYEGKILIRKQDM